MTPVQALGRSKSDTDTVNSGPPGSTVTERCKPNTPSWRKQRSGKALQALQGALEEQ